MELRRWQEMELAKSGDGGWLEQRICLLFPFDPPSPQPAPGWLARSIDSQLPTSLASSVAYGVWATHPCPCLLRTRKLLHGLTYNSTLHGWVVCTHRVPRPFKFCDWMLNSSRDHFGSHQGHNVIVIMELWLLVHQLQVVWCHLTWSCVLVYFPLSSRWGN